MSSSMSSFAKSRRCGTVAADASVGDGVAMDRRAVTKVRCGRILPLFFFGRMIAVL